MVWPLIKCAMESGLEGKMRARNSEHRLFPLLQCSIKRRNSLRVQIILGNRGPQSHIRNWILPAFLHPLNLAHVSPKQDSCWRRAVKLCSGPCSSLAGTDAFFVCTVPLSCAAAYGSFALAPGWKPLLWARFGASPLQTFSFQSGCERNACSAWVPSLELWERRRKQSILKEDSHITVHNGPENHWELGRGGWGSQGLKYHQADILRSKEDMECHSEDQAIKRHPASTLQKFSWTASILLKGHFLSWWSALIQTSQDESVIKSQACKLLGCFKLFITFHSLSFCQV